MWLAILIGLSIAASWATLPTELALALTIVSIVLGGITLYQGWKMDKRIEDGNKRLEAMQKDTQRMIEEGNARTQRLIEEGNRRLEAMQKETERLIVEIHQRTLEVLERMDKRAEERHKELVFK